MHKSNDSISEHTQQSPDVSPPHLDPVLDLIDRMFAIEIRQQSEELFHRRWIFVRYHGGDVLVLPPGSTRRLDDQRFAEVFVRVRVEGA